jgi:protein TonB
MLIGVAAFSLLVSLPLLVKKLDFGSSGGDVIDGPLRPVVVTLPPPDVPLEPVVQQPATTKSAMDIRRFTPPVVAPESEEVESLATQEQLRNALVGRRDIDGDPDGGEAIIIETAATERQIGIAIIGGSEPLPPKEVDIQAEPVGGMAAFRQYIAGSLAGIGLSDGLTVLHLEIRFVVEKNGELTDIQVTKGGLDPEVADRTVRALSGKDAPKWSPAVKDGLKVRMSFKLPITIQVDN